VDEGSEVIIGTPTGIQDRSIRERMFDWLIFDEATAGNGADELGSPQRAQNA